MPDQPTDETFVLYGVENSYYADIAESIERIGHKVVAGIVVGTPRVSLHCVPVVLPMDDISPKLINCAVVAVNIVPGKRKKQIGALSDNGFHKFRSVLDPAATISHCAQFGRGCYVNAGAVIGSFAELSDFVFVGRQTSVGHHCRLEDYCTLGPGVTIASHCHFGKGVMVGAGATVAPNCNIGSNSVIGAGTTVIGDVPGNTVVVGGKARQIRSGISGYANESV